MVPQDDTVLDASSGKLIVYEREYTGGIETLATAYADGLTELMAAMFHAGCQRGRNEGYAKAQADIRKAIGAKP